MDPRSLIVRLAAAGLLALSGSAMAVPMTVDSVVEFDASSTTPAEALTGSGRGDVNELEAPLGPGQLDFVEWLHEFTIPGGNILGGTLLLSVTDNEADIEDDPASFDVGTLVPLPADENPPLFFGDFDTGTYEFDLGADLLGGGSLSLLLASNGGDFFLDKSVLSVSYDASVPEPASILLLGGGLLGLGAFARRQRG